MADFGRESVVTRLGGLDGATSAASPRPGEGLGDKYEVAARIGMGGMGEIWMGERRFGEAVRTGKVQVDGPKRLAREFPGWLELSVFAATTSQSSRGS
ncbi:MAG: hypothetical protein ACYTDX_05395 [Planctomycetota bacterium]|jgi:hypothetical protein